MRKFLFFFSFLMVSMVSFADSPLTSTSFCKHYFNNRLVLEASETHVITIDMIDYIVDPENPVADKVALINALGWREAPSNYNQLLSVAIEIYKVSSVKKLYSSIHGETLICFAYMKAMSDYFDVKEAVKLAKRAQKQAPDSYCVNFIAALIQSQAYFHDSKWNLVYSVLDDVNKATWKYNDFSDEAAASVMEYISEYKVE